MDQLKSFFKSVERFLTWEMCVQCHNTTNNGYEAITKEGFQLYFCSPTCALRYWNEFGKLGMKPKDYNSPPNLKICRFPGCNKPCYVEGRKVHDYCGRTHAQQHGAMLSSQTGGGRTREGRGGGGVLGSWGEGRTTGYGRQSSGGENSHYSHFQRGWGDITGPILFYNRGEPYYEFTNFYQAIVKIDGEDWLTTEHYFQAQKFVGTPLVGTIRLLERPREAFDKSRDPRYSSWRRNDWEEVKEDVMFKALQAKFTQHEYLKKMLLDTQERKLVEHSPYDSYWGDGGDGSGKNRLGILLMRLRDDLTPVRAPSPPTPIHPQPIHKHQDNLHQNANYQHPPAIANIRAQEGKDKDSSFNSPLSSNHQQHENQQAGCNQQGGGKKLDCQSPTIKSDEYQQPQPSLLLKVDNDDLAPQPMIQKPPPPAFSTVPLTPTAVHSSNSLSNTSQQLNTASRQKFSAVGSSQSQPITNSTDNMEITSAHYNQNPGASDNTDLRRPPLHGSDINPLKQPAQNTNSPNDEAGTPMEID